MRQRNNYNTIRENTEEQTKVNRNKFQKQFSQANRTKKIKKKGQNLKLDNNSHLTKLVLHL